MAVEVGDTAPGFTLPSEGWNESVVLGGCTEEGPVVLLFYPDGWSSTCTDQMRQLQEQMGRFEEKGAKVLAISADTHWSHRTLAGGRGIEFPLLSDFDREVISAYGVEHEIGFPERAYFVIGRGGVVRIKKVEATPKDQPEANKVLQDLEKAL